MFQFNDSKIHVIDTFEAGVVAAAFDKARKEKLISVDTETTGLNPRTARLRLLQVGFADGLVFVFDMFTPNVAERVVELLPKIFASETIVKVAHNAKFDIQFVNEHIMKSSKLYPAGWFCTQLGAQLISCGRMGESKSLENTARRLLGVQMDKTEQKSDWSGELTKEQMIYAARDAQILLPLREKQLELFDELGLHRVATIEMEAMLPIAFAELHGIKLDVEKWTKLLEEKTEAMLAAEKDLVRVLNQGVDWTMKNPERPKRPVAPKKTFKRPTKAELEANPALQDEYLKQLDAFKKLEAEHARAIEKWQAIPKEVPATINLDSPAQVLKALNWYGMGLEETGEPYLIKQLPSLTPDQKAIVEQLLDYRGKSKSVSAFGQSFLDAVEADGRVHPGFNQIGAEATGRMSCSGSGVAGVKINVQQVPSKGAEGKRHRECFIAPEGRKLIGADYSQMELRLLAQFSADPNFCKAFNEGLDLHTYGAHLMFGVPMEEVTADLRAAAKALNFGTVYGIGPRKVAANTGMSLNDADRALKNWHRAYPRNSAWLEAAAKQAQQQKFSVTPFGRLIRYEYDSNDKGQWSGVGRNGMNAPIQGANADITKLAAALFWRKTCHMDARIVNFIHDELVVETSDELAEQVKEILVECMVAAARTVITLVPVIVEADICQYWKK